MRLDNTHFDYYVDYITKKIHLLDLNNFSTMTLTNAMCPEFQAKLIEKESLLSDVIDFEWLCYGTDGLIASYRNYNFKFANSKLPYLYPPYLEKMEKRRSR
jgi:hypothetical protein